MIVPRANKLSLVVGLLLAIIRSSAATSCDFKISQSISGSLTRVELDNKLAIIETNDTSDTKWKVFLKSSANQQTSSADDSSSSQLKLFTVLSEEERNEIDQFSGTPLGGSKISTHVEVFTSKWKFGSILIESTNGRSISVKKEKNENGSYLLSGEGKFAILFADGSASNSSHTVVIMNDFRGTQVKVVPLKKLDSDLQKALKNGKQ